LEVDFSGGNPTIRIGVQKFRPNDGDISQKTQGDQPENTGRSRVQGDLVYLPDLPDLPVASLGLSLRTGR
jgi:hypothetical protein